MYATVLPILAKQMGLEAYYKGHKPSNTLWVAGPDDAALDRFEAQAMELMAKLEVQLNAVAIAFVKEHLGVELKVRGT